MGVLRRRYHVSLIASTGPGRVSSLLGLSKTQGGKDLCLPWSRREAERFLFAHPGMPPRPDLSVIAASGPGVSPG